MTIPIPCTSARYPSVHGASMPPSSANEKIAADSWGLAAVKPPPFAAELVKAGACPVSFGALQQQLRRRFSSSPRPSNSCTARISPKRILQ